MIGITAQFHSSGAFMPHPPVVMLEMALDELLDITPEELVGRLLDRRRLLADQLPFIIQGLEESVDEFQGKYDKLAPKYRNAMEKLRIEKLERDEAHTLAKELRIEVFREQEELISSGQMINLDPNWKRDKLLKDLKEVDEKIQTSALDHIEERKLLAKRREIIKQNDSWLENRKIANPEVSKYLEKRSTMSKLYKKGEIKHKSYIDQKEKTAPLRKEFEAIRKDLKDSKGQLEAALRLQKESERAVEYWSRRANEGVGRLDSDHLDLMRFSNKVKSGGFSRAGIRRRKRNKGGEEE